MLLLHAAAVLLLHAAAVVVLFVTQRAAALMFQSAFRMRRARQDFTRAKHSCVLIQV
jgi:hypothetical protein